MIPVTWRNRRTGEAKLKINEMGSRYLFICLYIWLEKFLSRGHYMNPTPPSSANFSRMLSGSRNEFGQIKTRGDHRFDFLSLCVSVDAVKR